MQCQVDIIFLTVIDELILYLFRPNHANPVILLRGPQTTFSTNILTQHHNEVKLVILGFPIKSEFYQALLQEISESYEKNRNPWSKSQVSASNKNGTFRDKAESGATKVSCQKIWEALKIFSRGGCLCLCFQKQCLFSNGWIGWIVFYMSIKESQ